VRAPVQRRPMTEPEEALVRAISKCSFPVASSPKRFARDIHAQLEHGAEITEAQAAYLRRLVSTYRRQISASAIPEAERYLLTASAAQMAREALHATRWTATPGQPVPSWVVRLTGKATVAAIVAKWGEGATFERPMPRSAGEGPLNVGREDVREDVRPRPGPGGNKAPLERSDSQLALFDGASR
jgi:hypothetical protein